MTDKADPLVLFWIVVVLFIVGIFVGSIIGHSMGLSRACDSVKMEWVKDKCMKVTREEVK